MADLFVLAMLSRSRIILDREYRVAWDCEAHKATIIYTQVGCEQWETLSQEKDTRFFDSELEAHAYLNLLDMLNWKPENLWRNI